jgi:thioredoxin 1
MAKQITDQNASEILASDKLVVIDFWATWCGPCQRLSPIVEQLAEEYEGRAEICKYNVDEGEDLTIKYGIRNIPVVMLIKNGEVVGKKVGLAAKADLQKLIDANL